jgi:aerobic-type carbon monoxide dehydrogenase small subunit (CoxS/CutS family)
VGGCTFGAGLVDVLLLELDGQTVVAEGVKQKALDVVYESFVTHQIAGCGYHQPKSVMLEEWLLLGDPYGSNAEEDCLYHEAVDVLEAQHEQSSRVVFQSVKQFDWLLLEGAKQM